MTQQQAVDKVMEDLCLGEGLRYYVTKRVNELVCGQLDVDLKTAKVIVTHLRKELAG